MKRPRADVIRITVRGVVQEVRPTRGQSIAKIAETIAAVAPEVIELHDKDNVLLRAIRPETDPDLALEQPKPPKEIQADGETLRVNHMASLLAKAYEHATTIAFGKLVELVERMDARMESTETRLERMEGMYRRVMYEQLQDLQEQALAVLDDQGDNEEGSWKDQMAQTLFASFIQGRNAKRAAARAAKTATGGEPTNGKGS